MEPAWYTVWVEAPTHVELVDGVSYDGIPTTRLPPPIEREILGPRRPTGWVLQNLDDRCGLDRGILHTPGCDEVPQGAPVLKVNQALDAAETPGVRLCSRCGAKWFKAVRARAATGRTARCTNGRYTTTVDGEGEIRTGLPRTSPGLNNSRPVEVA
ncbi:DUF6233 domain-containing protein [Streptomyces sp. IB201691-2A2]|uniref:DUF6233 domain-containing protein n=1 Tax=Streptomyces sp. IB201691-2A2 TaxID=2561920 RepID=UPI00117BFE3A|nr:DUF6233 domain-containing protein [Streptomyces sp. IB201691-2A2]TRO62243.1 hypothetical protein E4K73_23840 [Streptomyces sp. IB201691-2A2]